MDLREKPQLDGVLTLELVLADGTVVERRRVHNLITTAGRALLARLLMGKVDALPTHWGIVVGQGVEPARPADTGLHERLDMAEDTAPRVEVVADEGGPGSVRATVSATLPPPAPGVVQPLTEAGIQITVGNEPPVLFNRVRFEPITRGDNMRLKLTWEISF